MREHPDENYIRESQQTKENKLNEITNGTPVKRRHTVPEIEGCHITEEEVELDLYEGGKTEYEIEIEGGIFSSTESEYDNITESEYDNSAEEESSGKLFTRGDIFTLE